jgi:hypothetical protein
MGVPNSEVGYTPAMPRREDHEVHNENVVALGQKKSFLTVHLIIMFVINHLNAQNLVL